MKNVYKIILIVLTSLNVNCQTIPYNSYNYQNGAYLKDIDNEFPFWLGTWEGTVNEKKYEFTFVLFEHKLISFPNSYHYSDMVVCKLKVTNLLLNQVIYDESSFNDYNDYKINGLNCNGVIFNFGLFENQTNCYQTAEFQLMKINSNTIEYRNFRYNSYDYWDCNYQNQNEIPMYLPKVDLMLTRQ